MSIRLSLHRTRLESVCAALVGLDETSIRLRVVYPPHPDQPMLQLACDFPDALEVPVRRALFTHGRTAEGGAFAH